MAVLLSRQHTKTVIACHKNPHRKEHFEYWRGTGIIKASQDVVTVNFISLPRI